MVFVSRTSIFDCGCFIALRQETKKIVLLCLNFYTFLLWCFVFLFFYGFILLVVFSCILITVFVTLRFLAYIASFSFPLKNRMCHLQFQCFNLKTLCRSFRVSKL